MAALDKKRLWKDIEREERRKARLILARLRAELRGAKVERKAQIRGAVARCRSERLAARERAKALRLRGLAEIRDAARAEREAARASCGTGRTTARSSADRQLAALTAELERQTSDRAIARAGRPSVARASAKERRAESDDEVRANIPPDLAALFERVKRGIKGTPRMSRTEAFFHFAEEHPDEAIEGLDAKTDALIREMEKLQRSSRR